MNPAPDVPHDTPAVRLIEAGSPLSYIPTTPWPKEVIYGYEPVNQLRLLAAQFGYLPEISAKDIIWTKTFDLS